MLKILDEYCHYMGLATKNIRSQVEAYTLAKFDIVRRLVYVFVYIQSQARDSILQKKEINLKKGYK